MSAHPSQLWEALKTSEEGGSVPGMGQQRRNCGAGTKLPMREVSVLRGLCCVCH